MKIISTTDLSREGSDCFIHESVSLAEQFDMYFVVRCQKVIGGQSGETVEVVTSSRDCGEVMEKYYDLGGKI